MKTKTKKILIIIGTVAFGFIIPPLLVIIGNPKTGNSLGELGLLLMGISLRIIHELRDAEVNRILSAFIVITVHFAIYFFIGFGISKVAFPKTSTPTAPDK